MSLERVGFHELQDCTFMRSLVFFLFIVFFSNSYGSPRIEENILSPFNLPIELKVLFHEQISQNVVQNGVSIKRKAHFIRYRYNNHEGNLKFFIYDSMTYFVNQYDYLKIKCLQNIGSINFRNELLSKALRKNDFGVKKVHVINEILDSTTPIKNSSVFENEIFSVKGKYHDRWVNKKNVPFNLSLELFEFSIPTLVRIEFEKSYDNLEVFLDFYEAKKERIWLLFCFENTNYSKISVRRQILFCPKTFKVVSNSFSKIDNSILW